jgi:hypothetical protein
VGQVEVELLPHCRRGQGNGGLRRVRPARQRGAGSGYPGPRPPSASRHPEIIGELTSVAGTERRGRYTAEGDLTIAGRTRRLTCEVAVYLRDGLELEADWEQILDIRDFDVALPPVMRLQTHPEVQIRVHLEAERQ